MAITFDFSPMTRARREDRQLQNQMTLAEFQSVLGERRDLAQHQLTSQRQQQADIRGSVLPMLSQHINNLKAANDPRGAAFEEALRETARQGGVGELPQAALTAIGAAPRRSVTAQELEDNRIIELRQRKEAGMLTTNERIELEYRDQAKDVDARNRKRKLDLEDVFLQHERGRGRAPTDREQREYQELTQDIQSRRNLMNLLMGGLLNQAPGVGAMLNAPGGIPNQGFVPVPAGSVPRRVIDNATGEERTIYRTPNGRWVNEDGSPVIGTTP